MRSVAGLDLGALDVNQTPEQVLYEKCTLALGLLGQLDLTFGEFIVAVCYGNSSSRTDSKMQVACASLLCQYMPPTTSIDKSSYSGNSQVIPYVMQQLGLNSTEEQTRLELD